MRNNVKILGSLIGIGIPVCFIVGWQQKCIEKWREEKDKNRAMFWLMNQWVNLKQEGGNLDEYFIKKGYKKIAIYGMGAVGQRLVKELKDSEIEITYGIDKNSDNIYSSFRMMNIHDDLPEVDVVVVTVIKEFDAICEKLSKKLSCSIEAIEDILDEV